MILTPDGEATVQFLVFSGANLVNAASPSAIIYKGAVATAIVPTIANPSTGVYQVSFTVPGNWVDYDSASVLFSGTVNGLTVSGLKEAGTVLVQSTILSAAQAAQEAAEAIADAEFAIDRVASTGTQYNADGSVRKVFDLKDKDGNPADPGIEPVLRRIPR